MQPYMYQRTEAHKGNNGTPFRNTQRPRQGLLGRFTWSRCLQREAPFRTPSAERDPQLAAPQAISEGSNNVRYAVLQTVEPCGWPECCKLLFEGLEA